VAPRRLRVLLVALLFFGGCRGGCRSRTPPGHALLSGLPESTAIVASVDLARIRSTSLWSRLAALAEQSPADRQRLQRFTERTGLDPLRQIHRIAGAFPDDAQQSGQFALVIEGEGFDEQRLIAYARAESGLKLEARSHGRRTLYGSGKVAAFLVGSTRLVVGAGGWAEAMAELADGGKGSAADNAPLVHLVERVNPGRALWFAALVPDDVRKSSMANPKTEFAGSMRRVAASANLGPGLDAELVADLSNAADARRQVAQIQTTIKESKRNAQVLMMGLGPYLDALSVHADGYAVRAKLTLAEPQVKDLIDRLATLARLARKEKR